MDYKNPSEKDMEYMDKWTRKSAITHGISDERLMEICSAERDGRCVVLFCKVGDTVFAVGNNKIVEARVQEIYFDDMAGLIYLVDFECDNSCDGCPFNSWSQTWEGEWECSGEYGSGEIKQTDFGKTAFLAPEAAEAALKGDREQDGPL